MSKNNYNLKYYTLNTRIENDLLKVSMQVTNNIVNTRYLPATFEFLKHNFPAVLNTKCFNEKLLPFCEEVKYTEIGHLFEHVLIAQIKEIKLKMGHKKFIINGRTYWNWNINPYGKFEILVSCKDINYIEKALRETIKLVDSLFDSHYQNKSYGLAN